MLKARIRELEKLAAETKFSNSNPPKTVVFSHHAGTQVSYIP